MESILSLHKSSGSNNACRIQTYNSAFIWQLPDGEDFTQVSSSGGLENHTYSRTQIILSPPNSSYVNQAWQFYSVDGNQEVKRLKRESLDAIIGTGLGLTIFLSKKKIVRDAS